LLRHFIAYGNEGLHRKGMARGDSTVIYGPGLYPAAEGLHQLTYLGINLCTHPYTDPKIDQVAAAFYKELVHLEDSV
jgi:hypothetical protein